MRPSPSAACSPEELRELLRPLAAGLIWWQPAEQSLRHPDRVIAQVLQRAEPSLFSPRSWNYWDQILGLALTGPAWIETARRHRSAEVSAVPPPAPARSRESAPSDERKRERATAISNRPRGTGTQGLGDALPFREA
jgi:hypothetical protein